MIAVASDINKALDTEPFKIDTEDKGISFPVGERSTLKG